MSTDLIFAIFYCTFIVGATITLTFYTHCYNAGNTSLWPVAGLVVFFLFVAFAAVGVCEVARHVVLSVRIV
jgi:hypothetical protein